MAVILKIKTIFKRLYSSNFLSTSAVVLKKKLLLTTEFLMSSYQMLKIMNFG